MDKDQLDGLLALKVVSEKKNFAAAARILKVSPAAISKIIKQLETKMGVVLLTRTTRSMSLTETGEKFLNQANPAIEQILEAMKEASDSIKKPSGRLRLNLPTGIYSNYLKRLIISFVKKFPDISIELNFENAATDIFEKGFDAGIRVSDILAKDLVAIKLFGPIRFVVIGSPKYFNKHGRPKHPKDLVQHDCICIGKNGKFYDKWEFEHKKKEFSVQVKGPILMNDPNFAIESVLDGAGLMYTSEDTVADKIKSGQLEIVLNQFAASSTGYYLYFPQRSQVQPKLRSFINHIKEYSK